ncbi:MAG: hypothetical protein ABSF48_11550, partial [Thermodesulfobacteriota bacterium]
METPILDRFFQPRSIALIGATSTPGFGYGMNSRLLARYSALRTVVRSRSGRHSARINSAR